MSMSLITDIFSLHHSHSASLRSKLLYFTLYLTQGILRQRPLSPFTTHIPRHNYTHTDACKHTRTHIHTLKERERERERESVCVCVRERESMCVCERERACVCVCVCVCV